MTNKVLIFFFNIVTNSLFGWGIIFFAIDIFGKTDFLSLNSLVQFLMIVLGVSIVSNDGNK